MAKGNPVGTIFVEFDLSTDEYNKKEKQLLVQSQSTSLSMEKNFRTLGTQSDLIFDAMKKNITNSYNMIANSCKSSTDEIRRAHEAMNAKISAIDKQQFGEQKSFVDNLKGHWLATTAVIAVAIGTMYKGWNLAKMGAEFAEQQGILDNLATKYKTTADSIISDMQRASEGMIAKTDLMTVALGGLAKGLKPDQLINLADAAKILGDAVGQSATTALNDLTQALETGRTKGLKNYLGANLDLEASFGDLATKMTDVERAQALYNMTMISAIELQKQQKKEVDDTADKMDRLEAKYKDATLTVAQYFKSFIVGVADLAGNTIRAGGVFGGLTDTILGTFEGKEKSSESAAKTQTDTYQKIIDKLKETIAAREADKKAIIDTAKVAEDWAKTQRDLMKDISGAGLDEFSKKIVDIQAKAEEYKIKYKDIATAQVDIERWAASQISEVVKDTEVKRLETMRDAATKRLEIEKDAVSKQVEALGTLKEAYKTSYDEAISKAKEYAALEAKIREDLSKRNQFIAGGFGAASGKSLEDRARSESSAIDELVDTARYSRNATAIETALDSIEKYLDRYRDAKDEMGRDILSDIEYQNEYTELTDRLKSLGDAAGQNKEKSQSLAEQQKAAMEATATQIESIKTKVSELDAEIAKTREIKIDTSGAEASIDALKAKMNEVGLGAISLGAGGGGMTDLAAQLTKTLQSSPNNAMAITALRDAMTALGQVSGSSGGASMSSGEGTARGREDYGAEFNTIINEYFAMIERSRTGFEGFMDGIGERAVEGMNRVRDAWDSINASNREAASWNSPGWADNISYGDRAGQTYVYDQYAMGTDYVPKTGPYLLHQGEAVTPKEQNKGRGDVTINMGGITLQGVTDMDEMARQIVKPVERELRRLATLQ